MRVRRRRIICLILNWWRRKGEVGKDLWDETGAEGKLSADVWSDGP